ncbi:MAG: cell division protein ZapA [Paracoccaceae bacterium]
MPEVNVEIGERKFAVVCDEGEETHLLAAAQLLNDEAMSLKDSIGRVPESRMLLMAGLMLSDKTIGLAWQLQAAEERVKQLEERLKSAEARMAVMGKETGRATQPQPQAALTLLERLASEVEAIAGELEARAAG